MIRRFLRWLGRVVFKPRVPPVTAEEKKRERDRIARILHIQAAELERELTMLRIVHRSCTHRLLNG